jgi:hypothetical protein
VAQQGDPFYAAVTQTAPGGPPTLKLTVEFHLGPPSANCTSMPFSGWNGQFTAKVVSRNGLSAQSQPLTLAAP